MNKIHNPLLQPAGQLSAAAPCQPDHAPLHAPRVNLERQPQKVLARQPAPRVLQLQGSRLDGKVLRWQVPLCCAQVPLLHGWFVRDGTNGCSCGASRWATMWVLPATHSGVCTHLSAQRLGIWKRSDVQQHAALAAGRKAKEGTGAGRAPALRQVESTQGSATTWPHPIPRQQRSGSRTQDSTARHSERSGAVALTRARAPVLHARARRAAGCAAAPVLPPRAPHLSSAGGGAWENGRGASVWAAGAPSCRQGSGGRQYSSGWPTKQTPGSVSRPRRRLRLPELEPKTRQPLHQQHYHCCHSQSSPRTSTSASASAPSSTPTLPILLRMAAACTAAWASAHAKGE